MTNILAMMQGDALLYTLPEGGWFSWPDGAMASPAVSGVHYSLYRLVPHATPAPTPDELRAAMPNLSARQLRLALLSIGIAEPDVDFKLINDDAGMIEWKFASYFRRDHPLIATLGPLFSLPADQIDTLWMWASEL